MLDPSTLRWRVRPVALAVGSEQGDPRFAKFESVRDQALIAELEPGDALYLPKLWWHQVEGTEPLNLLVNYWWDAFSADRMRRTRQ